MHLRLFSCVFFYSCTQSLSTLHTGIPSWYGFILCAAFFSPRFAHVGLPFCLSNSLGSVFFTRLFPVAPLLNHLLLIFAYSHSHYLLLDVLFSNLNLRTTHLFSTIVVIKVGGRLCCLFGLLHLLFTRVLENFGCDFCILRSGIQGHAHPRCTCTCFADAA